MTVLGRLRDFYRWAKVPPKGVERASRYERVRRNIWMVASTFLAMLLGLGVLFVIFTPIDWLGLWEPSDSVGAGVVFAVWVVASAIIDLRLFSWGVGYFKLIPPWQFRVEVEGDA